MIAYYNFHVLESDAAYSPVVILKYIIYHLQFSFWAVLQQKYLPPMICVLFQVTHSMPAPPSLE